MKSYAVCWDWHFSASIYRVAQNKISHQTKCNISATSGLILKILEAAYSWHFSESNGRYAVYPLHLNYTTTLPCETVTMKITIFILVLVLKSNKNVEIWHYRLSQLANSSNPCENSLFEDLFKVSAPSFHTSSKSFDIPVLAHAMSGFSFYRPRNLYPWLL